MLEFRQLTDLSIDVFVANETPEKKVGSIKDQCCYTLIRLSKTLFPIKIKYEVNQGGFLEKKENGVPIYREIMIAIFHYLYESEALRILLRKKVVELNRKHIEENTYLTILKRYEKEIKL